MRFLTAIGLRACCAALGLMLANVHAAETKSVVGATRDQVLARYGEPKSTIVAGSRELWFYPKERLTLRDGVVIDAEPIAEAPRKAAPPPADAAAAGTAQPAGQGASGGANTGAQSPAASAPASSANGTPTSGASAGTASSPAGSSAAAATPTAPAAESEPQISIKRVLPPGTRSSTATTPAPAPVNAVPPAAVTQPPVPAAPPPPPATTNPVATTPPPTSPTVAPSTVTQPPVAADSGAEKSAASIPAEASSGVDTAGTSAGKAAADRDAVSKKMAARRKTLDAKLDAEPEPSMFSTTSYVIAGAVLVVGVGFLVWRRRQRQLELAATALSRTPFGAATGTTSGLGARFTPELLAKLEWKRFEELVASYYSKTGVVAVRTKTGPASPVHIKISWKGEPRPFACVQCLSHPAGLIDAKPLQELVTVLAAEDIRRGYVVTTGKFNVPARDYAEEKHLTLLSGDIFLEKLNALPDTARAELMQEVTSGDYATPSCPKCDSKMIRSPDEPGVWRCPSHPEQTITSR